MLAHPSYCISPPEFPRSAKYDNAFTRDQSRSGSNAFWLAEWVCERLPLRPGMRVLDLGCGDARSSLFMTKEFGVEVWAIDLHANSDDNQAMLQRHAVADCVFPLTIDARRLPFAQRFFDVIVSIDAYQYFGSDDFYAKYIARMLRPDGLIGLVGGGLRTEWRGTDCIPPHIQRWWVPDHWALHSGPWWADRLNRSGCYEIETVEDMQNGWRHWLAWQRWAYPDNAREINALEADAGRNLVYWRVIARRNARNEDFTSWNPYGS